MKSALFLYLDPGTGSLLLYAILGICPTVFFLLKKTYYKVKQFFVGKSDSADELLNKTFDIVLYSEGGRYFNVFEPLIEEFINHNKKIVYVTPDEKDPAHLINNEFLEVIGFNNEMKQITFLNNLECNLLVSTTPHLDIYMWKKSKNVKKYVHIFHSPTGVDFYERYALSFYDVVISPLESIIEEQKYLDSKRKLSEKEYYVGGCTYLDNMYKKVSEINTETSGNKVILYAPSWGARSSLNTIGKKIIDDLLNSGYSIIFRPHPQSFISDKEVIDSIINKYGNNAMFELDKNKSGLESMVKSTAMISDFSGVVFDYYYLFHKPIFLASQNLNTYGYEVEDLPEDKQFDVPIMESISVLLNESNIKDLSNTISNNLKHNVNETLEMPFIGNSGEKTYEIIMKIREAL